MGKTGKLKISDELGKRARRLMIMADSAKDTDTLVIEKGALDSLVATLQQQMKINDLREGGGYGAGHYRSGIIEGMRTAIEKINELYGMQYETYSGALVRSRLAQWAERPKPILRE